MEEFVHEFRRVVRGSRYEERSLVNVVATTNQNLINSVLSNLYRARVLWGLQKNLTRSPWYIPILYILLLQILL